MVPKGWKRISIKDACEAIIDCVNKTAPVVDYETNFKMLRTTNIRNGRVDTQSVRYVTEETYLQWVKRGKPQKGDIIFTREAPVGEVGILEDDNGVFLGQRTMMYRTNTDVADNYYLFYSLLSEYCQKQIDNFCNGGTVAHMRVPDCGEILINTPSLIEQKKIAKILSTWDKAITTTEQLLVNSQQQKKALMQQLLTSKKRFPGFSDKWKKTTLGAVANMSSGGTPTSSVKEYYNGGIPWVSISDMTSQGKWIISTDKTLSIIGLENSSAKLYPENTILYAMYASIGECSIARVPLCSSQAILGIRPKQDLHYEYLYFFLSHLKERIKLQGQQGTQSNLNAGMVKKFSILLPSLEEQKAISTSLNIADQEIETLKQKLNHLKQEKKALMQQLLTGKRRVKTEAA
ncbi:restriction endonuclease subunit S [Pectobacterium versatile]|uniref:restriction endonuclease subunit S n=1 Tax=Pectobacterium versatile TaxID=2488639 RepID=UPI001CCAA1E3|nr:restriction endonuclease subunit S [Pectobacterium versatile]